MGTATVNNGNATYSPTTGYTPTTVGNLLVVRVLWQ